MGPLERQSDVRDPAQQWSEKLSSSGVQHLKLNGPPRALYSAMVAERSILGGVQAGLVPFLQTSARPGHCNQKRTLFQCLHIVMNTRLQANQLAGIQLQ